ncbi:MAG: hypothetical protein A2493_02035 [Candidatus Magasanikbacteria bacterium RIFOXYC12_FULL_33_11]|uniref:phosphoglycerate mutase (2,3-diphosphoglycerate-dependent) n=1 Tax=Candidatus Magasanikbacteria bacterium RIFOXYC12_FULL_33_11 TaxID=1798701 RepID=A0A1F6NNV3_9BACT|nr:MAG: hypothetical protein A2493_02035 [Candidatus Magasanikbacteria bacterium RIFOXYC12_FULL_33_11]
MMPIDLIFVRHAQSEGNAAVHLAKAGDDKAYTKEFIARHSSEWRLSEVGIKQAKQAGEFLRDYSPSFDRYYVSEYLRTLETAGHLELKGASWKQEFLLRERDRGDIDTTPVTENKLSFLKSLEKKEAQSFYWRPPNGESMADLCIRADRFLQTLHRECGDKKVIVVSHGETMWAFRMRLERLTQEEWRKLDESRDPKDRINNCQILHYTRRNPLTGELDPYLNWVKSICPTRNDWSWEDWKTIERQTFGNEDLLTKVNLYPRLFHESYGE